MTTLTLEAENSTCLSSITITTNSGFVTMHRKMIPSYAIGENSLLNKATF